jgi:hypothetical protein
MICPKCGSENPDDANFCTGCGAALDGVGDVRRPVSRDRVEQECFGLSGGALPGLVIGAFIIIVGLASALGGGFGRMMGSWGGSFGEAMGRWGGSVGSWGGGVGRFFAEWGTSFGSTIGGLVVIIVGLAIVVFTLYGRGRR